MQLDLDLRQPGSAPQALTVSKLTRRVRELLEGGVGEVWVEGEISNFRRQASGHCYFSLKDAQAQLACVLFAGQAAQLRGIKLADGLQVTVFGQITVYEQRGQYQLVIRKVQEQGQGALQAKFEELKRRLDAEGLFDPARKRKLPRFPKRIAVVTSPTGAAIRDFLHVLDRRQRGIEVIVVPVRVQGRGAAAEIATALREVFTHPALPPVDLVVVTRGGGSLEDLWEFNEEAVARAIAACPVPVVSAVGHEIDFTISDFVADLRAPTPSAAAEIIAADGAELLEKLRTQAGRLHRSAVQRVEAVREWLAHQQRTALFTEPARRLRDLSQTLDLAGDRLHRGPAFALDLRRARLERDAAALRALSPHQKMARILGELRIFLDRIDHCCRRTLAETRAECDRTSSLLRALSPKAALARGYTLTTDEKGELVRSAANAGTGEVFVTHFADGEVRSRVL